MAEGIWYSICWEPRDYQDDHSFIELDGCPGSFIQKEIVCLRF